MKIRNALILLVISACAPAAPAASSAAPAPAAPIVAPAPAAPTPAPPTPAAPTPAAPAPAAVGARTFGAPLAGAAALTALTEITGAPERFKDQVVRTEGTIARVCQAMGCWMELQASAAEPAVRVPMAGHAFFLPKDVAGRHATIEGRVALQELTPEVRAHLASEGAVAVASALSIAATTVVID
jgi:hypothetical protein